MLAAGAVITVAKPIRGATVSIGSGAALTSGIVCCMAGTAGVIGSGACAATGENPRVAGVATAAGITTSTTGCAAEGCIGTTSCTVTGLIWIGDGADSA